ncbi:MAG: hypothetical protein AB7N91_31135 [Candidatus Tectimicrobiota bacterium]
MGFIQRAGIGDALTALRTWEGLDDEMRRADQARVHRRSGLDGQECIHQGLVHAAAKLTQRLGQHTVGLRGIDLVLAQPTRIHHGTISAQAMTDIFIRGPQLMLEQFQGSEDTHRDRTTAAGRFLGEAFGETLLGGTDQRGPGEGVGPLTNGIGLRDEIGDVQGCPGTS